MKPASEAIFLPETEIAKRVSMSLQQWEATATVLERSGLPRRDPLFNNQRCWPMVQAFLIRRSGGEAADQRRPGIVENFDAFRSPRKKRSGS